MAAIGPAEFGLMAHLQRIAEGVAVKTRSKRGWQPDIGTAWEKSEGVNRGKIDGYDWVGVGATWVAHEGKGWK